MMNRHKMTAISLVLTVSLALTACGKAADSAMGNASVEANTAAGSSTQSETNRTAGELSLLPITTGGYWGANTGDAYYEYARIGEDMEAMILKTDYATGEQAPICRQEGCAHADESCNAYIANWGGVNLCFVKDAVYLLYTSMTPYNLTPEKKAATDKANEEKRAELATEEQRQAFDEDLRQAEDTMKAEAEQCSYVDKISADGTQKQRLAEFPRDWEVSFYATDGVVLYGSRQTGEARIDGESLEGVWLDLETGEYGAYPLGIGNVRGVYENTLVFGSVNSEQDLQMLIESGNEEAFFAAGQNATLQYYSVNPFTAEQKLMAEMPYTGEYLLGILNNKFYTVKYLGDTGDYSLLCFDPSTGAETTIKERFTNVFTVDAQSYVPLGKENEQQYLRTHTTSLASGSIDHYFLLDVNTGEISESLTRVTADEYGSTVSMLAAQTNDGRWLVHTGMLSTRHNSRARYALISPADFIAGKPTMTEVKMYENAL